VNYRDKSGVQLINKFSLQYLISIIEREKITRLERAFSSYDKKGVDIVDFIRIFLNNIEHNQDEIIYMVIALVNIFRKISENTDIKAFVKFTDLTDFICLNYGDLRSNEYILSTKRLPEKNHFDKSIRIRGIDIVIVINNVSKLHKWWDRVKTESED